MKKTIALILSAALMMSFVACSPADSESTTENDHDETEASEQNYDPDITFTTTDRDTNTYDESIFAEHDLTMINMFEPWCGPCVGEMPAFERLNNERLEGLQIICVNCMEDKATVDKFVKDNGYTFNIGYDENGAIEAYYPTDGIPYTLVINKGEITKIYVGAYDADKQYEEYKDAIEECFGK